MVLQCRQLRWNQDYKIERSRDGDGDDRGGDGASALIEI
jgi:hypothetical protein